MKMIIDQDWIKDNLQIYKHYNFVFAFSNSKRRFCWLGLGKSIHPVHSERYLIIVIT